jgi:multiple sugar transport system substrate-binding protein
MTQAKGIVVALAGILVVATTLGVRTEAADKATLTVAAYDGFDPIVKDAIPGWTKKHPGVEIKIVTRLFTEHHPALIRAMATGTDLPDVMAVEVGFISRLVETGGVQDLAQPPYEADRLRSKFFAYTLPQATTEAGLIGALPTDVGPGSLFYRKDILERAGVSEADLTRSWASYIDAGAKIREKTGASLVGNASEMKDILIRVGLQPGEGIYFDKGHKPVIDNPRFVRALTLAKTVRDRKLDSKLALPSAEWEDGLKRGAFATYLSGAWFAGQLASRWAPEAKGLWRAAPLPGGALASFGGTFYAIPKKSTQKSLAWEFVKYMTLDREQQVRAFERFDAFPALLAAQDDPFFEQPIEYLGGQKARVLWRDTANRIPATTVDRHDQLAADTVNTAVTEVLEQGKDPAEALERGKKYVERLIWSGRSR